jgi:hypothetical protein
VLNKRTITIVFAILSILFFLGGLGDFFLIQIIGFIVSGILFIITIAKKGKLDYPFEIIYFIFFIAFQLISLLWSKNVYNSLTYIVLFISSLGLFIFFYNYSKDLKQYFSLVIILIGFGYLVLYVLTVIFKIPAVIKFIPNNCCTLYSPYTFEHNHIGDYWAIVLVISLYNIFKNNKNLIFIICLFLSIPIIIVSQSRSAIIAIAFTLFYAYKNTEIKKTIKNYIKICLIILSIIFLIISFGKVTIFSRPYYFQAIASIFRYPLGVGMGNFIKVSTNSILDSLFLRKNAAKAHNIIFEVITGLGILSAPFIVWFINTFKKINANYKIAPNLFGLLSILIAVIFMFDMCYAIPTPLWLWFCLMGISLKSSFESKINVK